MSRIPLTLALTVLLAACASQAPVEPAVQAPAEPAPQPTEVAERPIPQDSLYPLLLAEFALRRREYGIALEQYLAQAPLLRDPGVSAHTTHLAQFMQRESAALEAVQLWVELEPDNPEANNTLAILLVRRGRNLEAAPHLEVVARAGAEANFPILLSGFKQMDPSGRARLVSAINELAAMFPQDPQMLLAQALLHHELGQTGDALAKLDQLFEQQPYLAPALLLEARMLLAQDADNPFSRIEAALKAQPDNQQLRLQYARMLTGADIEKARKQFEILSAHNNRDADLLLSLALINREMGDDLTAKAYLKQMLETGQRTEEAHFYLGMIAEEAGDREEAVVHYMKVQEDGRNFYAASGRIGRILLDEGQPGRLMSYFDVLRGRFPERSERLFALQAELHTRIDDKTGAISVLGAALDAHPDSVSLRYSRAMLGEQINDLALMESDLRAILRAEPDNATALNALGYTLANRTDRYAEAHQLIAAALELQPDEPAILDSMGWVLFRQGQYEDSLHFLQRAYERFPDPEVAAHLGEVLWVTGDAEGARAIWREALQNDPGHKVLVGTIKRLGVTGLDTGS